MSVFCFSIHKISFFSLSRSSSPASLHVEITLLAIQVTNSNLFSNFHFSFFFCNKCKYYLSKKRKKPFNYTFLYSFAAVKNHNGLSNHCSLYSMYCICICPNIINCDVCAYNLKRPINVN